jgi:two-component system sensor histidine kinase PilS (NtrC family)
LFVCGDRVRYIDAVTSEPMPVRHLTGATVAPVDEPVLNRLKWLLVFRLIVVTVLFGSSVVVRATTDEEIFARAALALYIVAGVAYASILAGAIVIRTRPSWASGVAYTQLISDAVIATAVVWLTGGAESVFVFIYSLSVLNAAIVLHRRAALVLAGVSVGLFIVAALATTNVPLRLLLPSLATNGASFFLVAVLSGYLTTQLTKTSARLEDARAQILKLEGLYAAVLGSLPSGVMSIGGGGHVVFVNAAGRDILGIVGDVVGESVVAIAPALGPIISKADSERFEVEVDLGARGRRVLGGSVAPLVGVDDPGRVVVFQDLTELRRLQEDVARSERLAELGRLAAGLAHEVRNPLAAMIGCLQLLGADRSATTGENGKLLAIVQREAERLSGLVQAFLTYARPADPVPQVVNVRTLLEETAAAVRHGLQSSALHVQALTERHVRVDPDQFRQVLWNVITNADRIGLGLARRLRVELGVEVDGDDVVLFVDDDGPGVPEELRQRIFEPFFTTRPDGNGLGLATCHQLVQRNGGVLGATRSPLGGARFTIRLPAVAGPPSGA